MNKIWYWYIIIILVSYYHHTLANSITGSCSSTSWTFSPVVHDGGLLWWPWKRPRWPHSAFISCNEGRLLLTVIIYIYIYIITIIRCYYNDWYINCNPIIISSNDNRMVELYYPNIIILVSYCPILILSSFNGLVEGKIYRKTSIFPIN
jgi:hypothetical protein